MLTLFEVMMLSSNWPEIMFNAIDAVDQDKVMQKDYRIERAGLFVGFIFLFSVILLSVVPSVIYVKFK